VTRTKENILAKIVLTNAVREVGMRELYRMNINLRDALSGLDGLARSMGYELEFHLGYNPRTMEKYRSCKLQLDTTLYSKPLW